MGLGLLYSAFIVLRYAHSIPALLKDFIIHGCHFLSNAFIASIDVVL